MAGEGVPKQERKETIPYVKADSDPELIAKRMEELFPLMQEEDKYRIALAMLEESREPNREAGFDWTGSAMVKDLKEVKALTTEVMDLGTLGVSADEIRKYSPILNEVEHRMKERLKSLKGKNKELLERTGHPIGYYLHLALQLNKLKDLAGPDVYEQILKDLKKK